MTDGFNFFADVEQLRSSASAELERLRFDLDEARREWNASTERERGAWADLQTAWKENAALMAERDELRARVAELERERNEARDRVAEVHRDFERAEAELYGRLKRGAARETALLGLIDDLQPGHKPSCAYAMSGKPCTCEAGEWELHVAEKLGALQGPRVPEHTNKHDSKHVAPDALEARAPRPPDELVGALQDRVHPASGRLLAAKPARIPEARWLSPEPWAPNDEPEGKP